MQRRQKDTARGQTQQAYDYRHLAYVQKQKAEPFLVTVEYSADVPTFHAEGQEFNYMLSGK